MRIARRFNAGEVPNGEQVPKGRLKYGVRPSVSFNRPFGTQIFWTSLPALKRRAILAMSLSGQPFGSRSLNFRKAFESVPFDSAIQGLANRLGSRRRRKPTTQTSQLTGSQGDVLPEAMI